MKSKRKSRRHAVMPGKRFKKIREALELSQDELGERLGKHRHTIWTWETEGQPVPRMAGLLMELWLKHGY